MNINSEELKNYIASVLQSITSAIDENRGSLIEGAIKFDLAVTNNKEGGGGIQIHIVEAGGKASTQEISRIQFEVRPPFREDPDADVIM